MLTFRLAPMSALLWALTPPLLALPAVFVVVGFSAPRPVSWLLMGLVGWLVLLYVAVWLYARPTRFDVAPDALVIVWPLRRQRIPRHDIASARVLQRGHFRRDFGWGARIGVGGLWGGFGWVWTSRRGLLDLYVSRTDGCVLVERRTGRPLLVTPERPDEFVWALRAALTPVAVSTQPPRAAQSRTNRIVPARRVRMVPISVAPYPSVRG